MSAVLAKSGQNRDVYDVLYLDSNGDGGWDSTERIVATEIAPIDRKVLDGDREFEERIWWARFDVGEVVEPDGSMHRSFVITWHTSGVGYEIMLRGQIEAWGGTGSTSASEFGAFAASIERAPIYILKSDGRVRFQHWMSDRFRRGRDNRLMVSTGSTGLGPSTFTRFRTDVLPSGVYPEAIVSYQTTTGVTAEAAVVLRNRCCGGLYTGSLRIRPDAVPGSATLSVRVKEQDGVRASSTAIPVTIE
jgi:hypothetical protein